MNPTNPIYPGDWNLDPPDEPDDGDFEDDDADFFEPNDYNDEYLDSNAP